LTSVYAAEPTIDRMFTPGLQFDDVEKRVLRRASIYPRSSVSCAAVTFRTRFTVYADHVAHSRPFVNMGPLVASAEIELLGSNDKFVFALDSVSVALYSMFAPTRQKIRVAGVVAIAIAFAAGIAHLGRSRCVVTVAVVNTSGKSLQFVTIEHERGLASIGSLDDRRETSVRFPARGETSFEIRAVRRRI